MFRIYPTSVNLPYRNVSRNQSSILYAVVFIKQNYRCIFRKFLIPLSRTVKLNVTLGYIGKKGCHMGHLRYYRYHTLMILKRYGYCYILSDAWSKSLLLPLRLPSHLPIKMWHANFNGKRNDLGHASLKI